MRRRNPLPSMSDSQVLKAAARVLTIQAKEIGAGLAYQLMVDAACRLRSIARRVPLWTDRAR